METNFKGLAVLRVLRHHAMLQLWLAQVIYLSVQFTASYAMIVLITNETHSVVMVGLVIIALSLPLVLFGAPAGALVDRMDRRMVLWISNIVRALATALFVVALVFAPQQYIFIYILAFFFSLVGLFFSPAEGAIIPRLVNEEELLPALSLYNLTLNMSQALGLLLLGPLALNLLPAIAIPLGGQHSLTFMPVSTLFIVITLLYLVATVLTATLPREQTRAHGERDQHADEQTAKQNGHDSADNAEEPQGSWKRMVRDLRDGWRLVRGDGVLLDALFQSCFGGLIMLTVAELATTFVQRLLDLPTSDTALVFAPAGIGLVLGSLVVPAVVARLGSTRTMVMGMLGTALGIGLIPVAQLVAHGVDPAHWSTDILTLVSVGVLTAIVGFSLDFVVVPAQTLMQQHSPDEMRGRVLALYQVLFNGGAIPVMLFVGAFTDLLGIVPVIYFIAAASILAAGATILRSQMRKRHGSGPDSKEDQQTKNVKQEAAVNRA